MNPNHGLKLDSEGRYLKFPGITIVAAIRQSDFEEWDKLYKELNKCELTKKYYSPLPTASYHMTTNNIYTERVNGGSNWNELVNKNLPRFQKLVKTLKEKEMFPEIHIKGIGIGQTIIHLDLKIPKDQEDLIRSIAKEFEISERIPTFFHLTLGYRYREIDLTTMGKIREELESNITFVGKNFILDSPKLCYFQDMTEFIPWDAEKNPFDLSS